MPTSLFLPFRFAVRIAHRARAGLKESRAGMCGEFMTTKMMKSSKRYTSGVLQGLRAIPPIAARQRWGVNEWRQSGINARMESAGALAALFHPMTQTIEIVTDDHADERTQQPPEQTC